LFVSTADASRKSIMEALSQKAGHRAGLIMGAIIIHAHESNGRWLPPAYRLRLAHHSAPAPVMRRSA
jgi:hypothetical protein